MLVLAMAMTIGQTKFGQPIWPNLKLIKNTILASQIFYKPIKF